MACNVNVLIFRIVGRGVVRIALIRTVNSNNKRFLDQSSLSDPS